MFGSMVTDSTILLINIMATLAIVVLIPTEAEANTGDILEIPLDLEEALIALGG